MSTASGTSTLDQTTTFSFSPAPQGYGFSGTISITDVDANCCPSGGTARFELVLKDGRLVLANSERVVADARLARADER